MGDRGFKDRSAAKEKAPTPGLGTEPGLSLLRLPNTPDQRVRSIMIVMRVLRCVFLGAAKGEGP